MSITSTHLTWKMIIKAFSSIFDLLNEHFHYIVCSISGRKYTCRNWKDNRTSNVSLASYVIQHGNVLAELANNSGHLT